MVTADLGCSTISFRHRPLIEALEIIGRLGFDEVDLGALPGVCDHVPFPLDAVSAAAVRSAVVGSGLSVRSINADLQIGNHPTAPLDQLSRLLDPLLALAGDLDAALVLPAGDQQLTPYIDDGTDLRQIAEVLKAAAEIGEAAGVTFWVEAPHSRRFVHSVDRAVALMSQLPDSVGCVLDVSHVVADGGVLPDAINRLGPRICHVHLRDARRGDINLSIGRGEVRFAETVDQLHRSGYAGTYTLELETHDVTEADREAATREAREFVLSLFPVTAR